MEAEKRGRIFISYGHDFTAEAVKFAATLTEAGYDVWIDYEGITPGADWRERITEAIISCDYFVALLSKYGLREGGVCLDELAIAVSRNRTNIRPIAVERGVEGLVPPSVAAIQFFDMSEWREVARDRFDDWYAERRAPSSTTACSAPRSMKKTELHQISPALSRGVFAGKVRHRQRVPQARLAGCENQCLAG